jgi:hypothetical protein
MWPFTARKCWCGSGLERGFCTHRSTIRSAGTGRPTRLQTAVKTHGNPTRKRRGKRA